MSSEIPAHPFVMVWYGPWRRASHIVIAMGRPMRGRYDEMRSRVLVECRWVPGRAHKNSLE